jgi:hypothetical protein
VRVLVVCLVTACGFSKPLDRVEVQDDASIMIDGPTVIDAPPDFMCLGATNASNELEVCVDPTGLAAVALTGQINTDASSKCAGPDSAKWTSTNQPAACFIVGSSITFTGDIDVVGTRPLVLFATATISASSRTLDASGRNTMSGAGPQSCDTFARIPGASGGGAGGSFMTVGGNGGDTGNGLGGQPPPPSTAPAVLRGGCQGQTGGGDNLGGGGGGAVYLVAGTMIDLGSSKLDLSGGGGNGGPQEEGGGGGGSGGMLVLYAGNAIMGGSSKINANGGGGAGGGGNNSTGGPGQETDPNTPLVGGTGGTATMGGGAGGDGSPSLAPSGAPSSNDGGGGGGGGAGYIRANKAFTNNGTSPLPSIVP